MEKPKVYFTRDLSPAGAIRAFDMLGIKLEGNVAVKLHSGEPGNQNFLRPAFMKDIVEHVNGTIVECNTAYDGGRNTTEAHKKTMLLHGWTEIADVDIMDAEGEMELPVHGGKHLDVNFVGKNLADYDSMLVLSHFKGHPMGGYGGALKNISIGIASSYGKAYIHGVKDVNAIWTADHDSFLECMADAAKSVVEYMHGKMAYVNIMCNMSVDCDCCAVAADPKIKDIGILSSLDPVALDQACLDLVYASDDEGKADLIERIESRHGVHTIEAAAEIGVGSREYELIDMDVR
ncbi:MAG: DUF362 domain-containing protein [Firmicutes bacterium]|nr:DUF362 domain-containing protein [Bacillota bacterium]